MKNIFNVVIIFFVIIVTGCSNSYVQEVHRGDNYDFRPGYPELRTFSASYFDSLGNSKVLISGELVKGSLIYKSNNQFFYATADIEIRLNSKDDTTSIVPNESFAIYIEDTSPQVILSQEVVSFEKSVTLKPGEYDVIITATDRESLKETTSKNKLFIPNPKAVDSYLTDIRMEVKTSKNDLSPFGYVNTYDIPNRFDSLKFTFQVYSPETENEMIVNSRLIEFDADTSVAIPMSYRNYQRSSLPYIGIAYYKPKVIESSRRVITDNGNISVIFKFPALKRGNYRFEVTTSTSSQNQIVKARDFSIKSTNYPSLKSARELLMPMQYIMREKEFENYASYSTNDSIKVAIDSYWLSHIKSRTKALQVLELYYSRVEDSNKQFSSFKEGWKTDPGMVYILFGPPLYVDYEFNKMTWIYTFDTANRQPAITFDLVRSNDNSYPFNHYILRRNQNLSQLEYAQINSWNDGSILSINK